MYVYHKQNVHEASWVFHQRWMCRFSNKSDWFFSMRACFRWRLSYFLSRPLSAFFLGWDMWPEHSARIAREHFLYGSRSSWCPLFLEKQHSHQTGTDSAGEKFLFVIAARGKLALINFAQYVAFIYFFSFWVFVFADVCVNFGLSCSGWFIQQMDHYAVCQDLVSAAHLDLL